MNHALKNWIRARANVFDAIIADAARAFISSHTKLPNFSYDLFQSQKESFNLVNGKDLCYDRLTTPLAYSLWYQGRRMNGFFDFFIDGLIENGEEQVDIFDLGAGTGAAQIALGIVYNAFLESHPEKLPEKLRIINVDSSPFMLEYNRKYLWPAFLKHFPASEQINIEFAMNSWKNSGLVEANNVWLTASYLFDITDQMEDLSEGFINLVKEYKPAKLFLSSSNQVNKRELLDSVVQRLSNEGYQEMNIGNSFLLSGRMQEVNNVRGFLFENYHGWGLQNVAYWNETSFYGKILTNSRASHQLSMIKLYQVKKKDRKELELSPEQKNAANFRSRPSRIIGSAGSGKTVVITEKVKQIVEESGYEPKLKILITTFNKELTKMIQSWLQSILDSSKVSSIINVNGEYQITFTGSGQPNIYIMHFDILPTRFGLIRLNLKLPGEHILRLGEISKKYIEENNIEAKGEKKALDPEFLWEEYMRVFYGKNIKNKNQYLEEFFVDKDTGTQVRVRQGRGNEPMVTRISRGHIYECINLYQHHLDQFGHSFWDVRKKFLDQLKKIGPKIQFDYLFVDEFQDCTRTDFKIFYYLLKDINNLTITGDLAQSIHLGKSATSDLRAVRKLGGKTLGNIKTFRLSVSYRLPFRISQAIEPISKGIVERWRNTNGDEESNVLKIVSVKNSPPGARPIVVYGDDSNSIASKIALIIDFYRSFSIDKFTLLENDKELASALWKNNLVGKRDSILRLKGIENSLIIWSSRIPIDDKKEVFEYLYTIFTRTTSILIIALFPGLLEEFIEPLKLLEKDKLIFWDEETFDKFHLLLNKFPK